MNEDHLFQLGKVSKQNDVVLGTFPCDISLQHNQINSVAIVLTRHAEKSEHGIPILRLCTAQHPMDYMAHEYTPAGHAAKIVVDWLHLNPALDEASKYLIELFLWSWSGVKQADDGTWHFANKQQRENCFHAPFINCNGEQVAIATHDEAMKQQLLDNSNIQVHDAGFCMKNESCYLLDACLMCPHFCTNSTFISALETRVKQLENKRDSALESDHPRLAEICHQTLGNIHNMLSVLTDAN